MFATFQEFINAADAIFEQHNSDKLTDVVNDLVTKEQWKQFTRADKKRLYNTLKKSGKIKRTAPTFDDEELAFIKNHNLSKVKLSLMTRKARRQMFRKIKKGQYND